LIQVLGDWYAYLGVEFIEPSYFTTDVMYDKTDRKNMYLYMNYNRTLNVYSLDDSKLLECDHT
jgi:hypothetical protein